jgi:hypothetical protein
VVHCTTGAPGTAHHLARQVSHPPWWERLRKGLGCPSGGWVGSQGVKSPTPRAGWQSCDSAASAKMRLAYAAAAAKGLGSFSNTRFLGIGSGQLRGEQLQ